MITSARTTRRLLESAKARADRFAVAWNGGMALEDLACKFSMRSPMRYAYKLREKGYPLVSRVRRERYCEPPPDMTPMTLLRPRGVRPDVHERFQMVYDRAMAREAELAGYVGLQVAEEWDQRLVVEEMSND